MIWFSWILWHINHSRLLNAKSSLYIRVSISCTILSGLLPPPQSTLLFDFLCACLFDIHLRFINFRFNIIGPYDVVLCCYLRLFSFSFEISIFCHIHFFSYVISPVCRLKYPYTCFSSHFCFLVFVVFHSGVMLPMLLLTVLLFLLLFTPLEFFTSVLADGFSMEFE